MTKNKLFAREGGLRPIIKRQWTIVLLCILATTAYADNLMRVAVKGGVTNNPMHDTLSIGGAGEMEIGYRWQHDKGWIVDVGLGIGYGATNNYLPDSTSSQQRTDYQGDIYTAHEQYSQLYHEYSTLSLSLPIMAGYEYRRFYAMAGVKLKGAVLNNLYIKGLLTESYEYDNLIDPLHRQTEAPYSEKRAIVPSVDVQICVEVGMRLTQNQYRSSRQQLGVKAAYIGAFVDYSVYSTLHTTPLTAGVKITWLLQPSNHNCNCWMY